MPPKRNRLDRPTREQIKKNRLAVRNICVKERKGVLYDDASRKRLRLMFVEQLEAQKTKEVNLELNHLIDLVKSDMSLEEFKNLEVHPYNQYQRERPLFAYHGWLEMKKFSNWRQKFNSTFEGGAYRMSPKIYERISQLPNTGLQFAFMSVYKGKDLGTNNYGDDMASMLEFVKNAVCHCNQKLKKEYWISMEELEEGISFAFPELSLFITNYCLVNGIPLTNLMENKKVHGDFNACKQAQCNYCGNDDDIDLFTQN